MTDVDAGHGALGPADACAECTLAEAGRCCGAARGSTLLRSDRVILALAGAVAAVITVASLTVPSSRHPLVLVPATATLLVALALSGAGWASLRRPGVRADQAAGWSLRLLPAVVTGVVVTVGAAFVRSLVT